MSSSMLKHTPFHNRIAPLCESHDWRRWAGHIVASKYELTHEREYSAIRNGAGLIDVSPLYKYRISGRDAIPLLNRIMTRDVRTCAVGQVLYTTWCDERGRILEDGTLMRLDDHTFRVTAAEPNLRWFQDNALGLEVTVADVSAALGALAVQGPTSRAILQQVADGDVAGLDYFHLAGADIAGAPVEISRTGYTGDLGYEVWVRREDATAVWDALVAGGEGYGLVPAGMLALDMARIEAGLILIDVDYTPANKAFIDAQTSTPYELGLGWTVALDKPGYFVGRPALEAEHEHGPAWQLVGLEIEWDALENAYAKVGLPAQVPHTAWRRSVPVYTRPGREAGYATSGCFSPLLKRYVVLAHVRSQYAAPGTPLALEITVEHMRRTAQAQVVTLPFFNPRRKRK